MPERDQDQDQIPPTQWRPLTETEIADLIQRLGVPDYNRQEMAETLRGFLVGENTEKHHGETKR